ncbi:transmembrane and immunoglobulin domain-containing protein 1 isoform X1 [Amphiprion ocellaris]|uniref:Ig-like domain-containing protein n=1 Tax=Amphiprion ocellaris TaxID=80972 RepID=A0A3Q1C6P0_AMPOC|nr:transmembrane and immunoglobulin domain-containing protein 1 isoform X1 [Amphiprion ocellaris]XP_054872907.1 transmembrane and immunoglobulin domain-containing protein 1 isoform X1 [Amphiprion ocellaris]
MKLIFRASLLHLLLYCATHTAGVNIESDPVVDGEGLIQAELNNTVSLKCTVGGDTLDDEELVWLRNGLTVKLNEENKKGASSVCVSPVIYDDNEATFTCQLKNNATVKASVTLRVTYPPELSGSEEVTVEEESKLVLSCDIWANPPVSSVVWALNGSMVDLLAGDFVVTTDGSISQLIASKVERSLHEGTYQCTANSPKYGAYSKTFYVTAADKTMKFPLMPMIAAIVVVILTAILAIVSRWRKIAKCFKK